MLRESICLWLGAFVFESGVLCQTYIQITEFVGGQIALKTFPTSINNQGAIVGYWEGVPFLLHGFVRSADGGTITAFDAPGPFVSTFAQSINVLPRTCKSRTCWICSRSRGEFHFFRPAGQYINAASKHQC